jgi:serine/threonine protein kinase/Tol biopolymer transport system component
MERGSLLNKRYRIVEILGQGGMAAVYRAIDENLGVEVAVKENLFTTEEYARQFRLEATILASLRQPNLPRVYDHFVIEQQGQYLVMDYIEGEDLRQRLDRIGPLPEQEVIVLGVAICDALSYMHSRRPMILHRDLKPGNVRITPQGNIYLVDFGLAKIVQGREATSTGARAMTPGYSPPEQYGTARTDHRSDIYSLGATLYSALTDALPEDGLARAMDQAELTPLIQHNPRISKRLAAVIEKCLEVRPDNRYQSADELKRDLMEARTTTRRKLPMELVLPPPPVSLHDELPDAIPEDGFSEGDEIPLSEAEALLSLPISTPLNETPSPPVSTPRSRRRTGLWSFFVALILILAGGAAAYVINPNLPDRALAWLMPSATPTILFETTTATPTPRPPEPTSTPTPSPSYTPTLTFTLSPPPRATETKTPILTKTDTPAPVGTAEGGGVGQIVFASDRTGSPEIWLMNVDGSGLVQLTTIAEGACQPRWSPDGMRIVFISPCPKDQTSYPGASLFIMDADGRNLTPLTNAPGGDYDPSWSPDSTQIVFTSLRGGIPQLYIINLADNSITPLTDFDKKACIQPAWSPDGKHIAYVGSDNRIWAMNVDGTWRHALSIGGGDFVSGEPAWSPDSTVVVFTRRRATDPTDYPWLMAVPYSDNGALPSQIPNSDLVVEQSYSPDGFWLVFKSWIAGNHDIYIMRSNGVDKRAIVTDPAYDFDPSWRPSVSQP